MSKIAIFPQFIVYCPRNWCHSLSVSDLHDYSTSPIILGFPWYLFESPPKILDSSINCDGSSHRAMNNSTLYPLPCCYEDKGMNLTSLKLGFSYNNMVLIYGPTYVVHGPHHYSHIYYSIMVTTYGCIYCSVLYNVRKHQRDYSREAVNVPW
jgi:hypothetical protein